MSKKFLSQFFTTNSDYILQGFEEFVFQENVADPFAGGCDLLSWATRNGAKSIKGYDYDQKLVDNKKVFYNNSLKEIPYSPFILTNPPYLGTNKFNKTQAKRQFLKEYEDLYLLAMKKIILASPNKGIVIIPVNFFSASNSKKLRKEFLDKFKIKEVNYFTNQVFEDTTYNVVAFSFTKQHKPSIQKMKFNIFPQNESIELILNPKYDYCIGGKEIFEIENAEPLEAIRITDKLLSKSAGSSQIKCFFNDYKTEQDYLILPYLENQIRNNIITLNCIDSKNESNKISISDIRYFGKDALVGKITSRNIASIILPGISLKEQEQLIPLFNQKLNTLRKKYRSLFLTNFRDNDRKRISFEFCYKLLAVCLKEIST